MTVLPAKTLGLLIAGGASRRFGSDKTRARLGEKGPTLAGHARETLERAGLSVVVAARGKSLFDDMPSLEDGPGEGPAAGLLGAALIYPEHSFVVLAVDLPAVPAALLKALTTLDADLAMPCWLTENGKRRREPLCALYRPPALARLASRVHAGRFDLQGLCEEEGLRCIELGPAFWDASGPPEDIFRNINYVADLKSLAALRHTLPTPRAER